MEGIHSQAVELFEKQGYTNIEYHPKSLPDSQLAASLRHAYVVGIRSVTRLTLDILKQAPKLLGIGCFCIGTDQVDLAAAQELGIPVFNAPFSNTRSVAELIIAEIIMLMRGIPFRNAMTHRGHWVKSASGCHEVRGKCLGIIGYGHIGTQVGILAEALGMRVAFFDIETKLILGNAQPVDQLESLLEMADVVTLHVPQTPQTHGMISREQLARMKPGAHLINAARGTVVDLEAMTAAIQSGHLAGAAIDVYPTEPKSPEETFSTPLQQLDQVILTPHIGGSTEEAQKNIGVEVAEKLIRYSDNGSTLTAVNFPEVSLPSHPGKHRLLHIHRNQPGVLSEINGIFSEKGINIASQYLQTNSKIGYVVIDIETAEPAKTLSLKRRLEKVTGTIRTRILY